MENRMSTRSCHRLSIVALTVMSSLAHAEPARAQIEIDRRRPAPARGEVSVDSPFGTITVRGWSKNEVLVQGTWRAGRRGFRPRRRQGGCNASASVPEQWLLAAGEDPAFRSTLTVFVLAGSRVSVDTVNAAVTVENVSGRVEVSSVNGGVRVVGPASAVRSRP